VSRDRHPLASSKGHTSYTAKVPGAMGRPALVPFRLSQHDGFVTVSIVLLIVALAVVVLAWVALVRIRPPMAARAALPALLVERRAVVVLDVDRIESAGPAVERLVHETAARVFAAMPDAEEVEVRARDGSLLGTSTRSFPEPHVIWLPEFLREPHHRPHRGPDLSRHLQEDELFLPPRREGPPKLTTSFPRVAPPREVRPPIVERFDLTLAVRSAVRNPDDPVDVIRAILEAGGLAVEVNEDFLRVGDVGIAVVHVDGRVRDALNHAYRRIVGSGAVRGLVVAAGYVDAEEIRRRELLAPQILHTGLAGVQRMADAVALGANPLRFAIAPALAPSLPAAS
jgi:hypothetical protein